MWRQCVGALQVVETSDIYGACINKGISVTDRRRMREKALIATDLGHRRRLRQETGIGVTGMWHLRVGTLQVPLMCGTYSV